MVPLTHSRRLAEWVIHRQPVIRFLDMRFSRFSRFLMHYVPAFDGAAEDLAKNVLQSLTPPEV